MAWYRVLAVALLVLAGPLVVSAQLLPPEERGRALSSAEAGPPSIPGVHVRSVEEFYELDEPTLTQVVERLNHTHLEGPEAPRSQGLTRFDIRPEWNAVARGGRCRVREGEVFVQWDVTRAVLAAQPLPIGSDASSYIGAVFNLKPQAEARLRMAPAACGGTLGEHLDQCSKQASWRLAMLDREPMGQAYARPVWICSLRTRRDCARLLCVQPVLERGSQSQPAEVDASVFDNDDVDDTADETQTVNQPLPEPRDHTCVACYV